MKKNADLRLTSGPYDSSYRIFTAKDPILFEGGDTNLYRYAGGDPLNNIDPDGLKLEFATDEARDQLSPAIAAIMKSKAGRRLLNRLEKSPTVFRINLAKDNAYQKGRNVFVDPGFHPVIESTCGQIAASTPRILAHELGHLTGTLDNGPARMNNVKRFENPIIGALEGCLRTQY